MNKSLNANLHPLSVTGDSVQFPKAGKKFKLAAVGSIIGALGIGVTSCCIVPLVLLSLGLSGAWMGSFAVLAPYKPLFIIITAALLGYGHYLVYFARKESCEGEACPPPRAKRAMKIVLWSATVLALIGVGIDYAEPYLLKLLR